MTFSEPGHGCGVTAIDEADCRAIVDGTWFFAGQNVELIVGIRNSDELDQDHVVPNVGSIFVRGIWFPRAV